MKFTAAELEEMRRADAEIEAEFRLTNDDLQLSRRIDRDAVLEDLPKNKRKLAEYQRAYREANREKLAEYQRAYYEANREKLAEQQRAYYEANREKVAEHQRAYREANREKLAEQQRAYYEANREKVAEHQRAIKDARRARGLTQKALAQALGVSQPCVAQWESGRVPAPWDKLAAILPELRRATYEANLSYLPQVRQNLERLRD